MKQRICEASYAKGYMDAKQEAKRQIAALLAVDGSMETALEKSSSRARTRFLKGRQLLAANSDLWRGPSEWAGTHKFSAALIAGVALGILLQQVISLLVFGLGVATGGGVVYWLSQRGGRVK